MLFSFFGGRVRIRLFMVVVFVVSVGRLFVVGFVVVLLCTNKEAKGSSTAD